MKKIILLIVIACTISGIGYAKDLLDIKIATVQEKGIPKKDCVMMIDGEMYVIKDGKKTEMTKAITMSNGTKVLANGEVYLKDGQSFKLSNGDCVYMNGKVENNKP